MCMFPYNVFVLSGLIWVQTVCKWHQQTTLEFIQTINFQAEREKNEDPEKLKKYASCLLIQPADLKLLIWLSLIFFN